MHPHLHHIMPSCFIVYSQTHHVVIFQLMLFSSMGKCMLYNGDVQVTFFNTQENFSWVWGIWLEWLLRQWKGEPWQASWNWWWLFRGSADHWNLLCKSELQILSEHILDTQDQKQFVFGIKPPHFPTAHGGYDAVCVFGRCCCLRSCWCPWFKLLATGQLSLVCTGVRPYGSLQFVLQQAFFFFAVV